MPTSLAFVSRPPQLLEAQRAGLEAAARELGLSLRLERTFYTPRGAPAAQLLRAARVDLNNARMP